MVLSQRDVILTKTAEIYNFSVEIFVETDKNKQEKRPWLVHLKRLWSFSKTQSFFKILKFILVKKCLRMMSLRRGWGGPRLQQNERRFFTKKILLKSSSSRLRKSWRRDEWAILFPVFLLANSVVRFIYIFHYILTDEHCFKNCKVLNFTLTVWCKKGHFMNISLYPITY